MKKIGLLFTGLLLILIICVYVFIPSSIEVTSYKISTVPQLSVIRALQNFKQWQNWWESPANKTASTNTDSFTINNISYKTYKPTENGASVQIKTGDKNIIGFFNVFNSRGDSTIIEWKMKIESSNNLFERVKDYFVARKIKQTIQTVLTNFNGYVLDNKNVYGFVIERTTFLDSLFLVNEYNSNSYPSPTEIYQHVDSLLSYCKVNGSVPKDYVLQNIGKKEDGKTYRAIVAICINKPIPETSEFRLRRMPINRLGTLVAKVTGGQHTVELAHIALQNYLRDYLMQIKALPFEILLTDRRQIPDTTKWETIVNYPCTPQY